MAECKHQWTTTMWDRDEDEGWPPPDYQVTRFLGYTSQFVRCSSCGAGAFWIKEVQDESNKV